LTFPRSVDDCVVVVGMSDRDAGSVLVDADADVVVVAAAVLLMLEEEDRAPSSSTGGCSMSAPGTARNEVKLVVLLASITEWILELDCNEKWDGCVVVVVQAETAPKIPNPTRKRTNIIIRINTIQSAPQKAIFVKAKEGQPTAAAASPHRFGAK